MHGFPDLHQGLVVGEVAMRDGGDTLQPPARLTGHRSPAGTPTCSMSLVCLAAESFCAWTCRSSWYWRQFFPSWMAYGGGRWHCSAPLPTPRAPSAVVGGVMPRARSSSAAAHLAEQAVEGLADGAAKLVDRILVDAPAPAVGGLAVETVLAAPLCQHQAPLQEPPVLLRRHQLQRQAGSGFGPPPHPGTTGTNPVRAHRPDLPLLEVAAAGVGVVAEGTGHLWLLAVVDHLAQTLPAGTGAWSP